jgi:O-antigen ligase
MLATSERMARVLRLLSPITISLVCALALAFAPFDALLPGVAFAFVAVLALIDPVYGLYAALLSVPVQEVVLLPGGLSYTQATMALALGAWALRALAHPERRVRWPALTVAWAALVWALLLAAAFSPYSTAAGLVESSRWGVALTAFVLTVATVRDQRRALGLIACLLAAPAATALLGLRQFVTGDGPPSFRIAGGFVRAYGTLGTANTFAGYMDMAWPLAAALGLWALAQIARSTRAERSERRANPVFPVSAISPIFGVSFLVGTFLLTFSGLLASFSRGAWLGAMAGALTMTALAGRRAALAAGLLLALGAGVLAAGEVELLPDVVAARVASIVDNARIFDAGNVRVTPENFAIVERMAHWQAGARMFLDRPLLGVGAGSYNLAYRDYFVDPWRDSRGHAHNYYVHIAAEAGALGLLAYLALLASLAAYALRALRASAGGFWRAASLGICGTLGAMAVHNLFENLHVLNMGIQLAALWGLLVQIPHISSATRKAEES